MIQRTSFKRNFKQKFIALLEMHSQHLAFFEFAVFESRFRKFYVAEIAISECAFLKNDSGKIYFGEIASRKYADFKFLCGKFFGSEIVFGKCLFEF